MKVVIFILIILIVAWYLSYVASRLDRLHHRAETSWEHLDALLQRRAALALEITLQCDLDPATHFLITQAATSARRAGQQDRSEFESSLSGALATLIAEEASLDESSALHKFEEFTEELSLLTETIRRAMIVHREAVDSAKRLRARWFVRFFHLAGRAPLPVRYAFEEEAI
jgi:hypothetical protein